MARSLLSLKRRSCRFLFLSLEYGQEKDPVLNARSTVGPTQEKEKHGPTDRAALDREPAADAHERSILHSLGL